MLTLTKYDLPLQLKQAQPVLNRLYVEGSELKSLLVKPSVAVVGSRKMTPYGKQVTMQICRRLAEHGVTIISGLAYGVDATAQQTALEAGGLNIGVLPCGLDSIYPRAHHNLASRIVEQGGALVSEYPPGTAVHKFNFVARNRIIAALSDIVLITEAAHKSGSLHTAQFALELGKEVMAVPGAITSATSAGTNTLLKQGASLVTSADDVLAELGIKAENISPKGNTCEEQLVLDTLAQSNFTTTELINKTSLDITIVNQTLTMLEINGLIRLHANSSWSLT